MGHIRKPDDYSVRLPLGPRSNTFIAVTSFRPDKGGTYNTPNPCLPREPGTHFVPWGESSPRPRERSGVVGLLLPARTRQLTR